MYNRAVIESKRLIYACDIGSTLIQKKRGNPAFGWVRLNPDEGTKSIWGSSDIQKLVEHLRLDIERGYSVSLGFEAPLFIPVPDNSTNLSKGRKGDSNRSWSAPAGAYVATLGIHQSAWILKRLQESSPDKCEFTLDFQRWPPTGNQQILFCWEAFVSGKDAHTEDHVRDAAAAAIFFFNNERNLQRVNAVEAENPFSMIGAVALWSDWVDNSKFIHKPSLVIKPEEAFRGEYQNLDHQ